jgi:hypothetical protein
MKKTMLLVGVILAFIIIGCHKPQISCKIVKPTPNATFEIGDVIDLALTVDVENTTIDEVQIYLDEVGYVKKSFFPFNFQIHTKDMEPGTHTIKALAIANNGVKAEETVSFNVKKYETPNFVSFSDGKFPKGWIPGNWHISSPGFDDGYCARVSYYSGGTLSTVKTCNGNINCIEFYAKGGSSYWSYPSLGFVVDGVITDIQLTTESWEKYTFDIPAGEHTFMWVYLSGDTDIYLDAIKFFKKS